MNHPLHKTEWGMYFLQRRCKKSAEECPFAHGSADLRKRPQKTKGEVLSTVSKQPAFKTYSDAVKADPQDNVLPQDTAQLTKELKEYLGIDKAPLKVLPGQKRVIDDVATITINPQKIPVIKDNFDKIEVTFAEYEKLCTEEIDWETLLLSPELEEFRLNMDYTDILKEIYKNPLLRCVVFVWMGCVFC
jgi:hypothetical protein